MNEEQNYQEENTQQEEQLEEQEEVVNEEPELEAEEQPEEQPQEEDSKEYNFRNLREAREKAERERDEALTYAYQYYQQLQNASQQQNYGSNAEVQAQPQQIQQDQIEELEDVLKSIEDDDLVDGRKIKKAIQTMSRQYKKAEKSIEEQKQQMHMQSVENYLKSTYSDFNDVVNDKTIARLNREYPNTAISLSRDPDIKTKALAVYEAIKARGLHESGNTGNRKDYTQQKARVQSNARKPRSSASGTSQQGESPMSQVNEYSGRMTKEMKQKLLKEMREASKRY